MKIYEKHEKNTKNVKKHIKSKEKRPKANASSHNACRFGYPFFLSPSDDDAMLEIPNPTPSVHQTRGLLFVGFLVLCWPKRKETRLSKIPQTNGTQRQVKSHHCTFIQNPQNSKNIKITTQNYQITAKSMNIYEKHKKTQKM